MSKKLLLLPVFMVLLTATSVFCGEDSNKIGLSEQEYKKLVKFSQKIRWIKAVYESGGINSVAVKERLGEPDFKNSSSIMIENKKEDWIYWHPCYASVRFVFIFDQNDSLIMLTAVQNLHPKIGDVYYDVDHFLSK